ncbi:hypothetical protein K439DRAFT_1612913 [Ramaria rubella]|nr:hypothetical protein K439DRAFT_1612913 [Ramaria rubella]
MPQSGGKEQVAEKKSAEKIENDTPPKTPSRWVRRHDLKINVETTSSQPKESPRLNCVNVDVVVASSPRPVQPPPCPTNSKPAPPVTPSRPSTPVMPDLMFSSISPALTPSPTPPPPPAPNLPRLACAARRQA